MIGLVHSPPQRLAQPVKPASALLTTTLTLTYHKKYLTPDCKQHTVLPDMARQVGEALLAAGAITIVDNGSTSVGEYSGYRSFTVRVTAINPLSSLADVTL